MKLRFIIQILEVLIFSIIAVSNGIHLTLDNINHETNINTVFKGSVENIDRGNGYSLKINGFLEPSYVNYDIIDVKDEETSCFKRLSHCKNFEIKFWFKVDSFSSKFQEYNILRHGPHINTEKGLTLKVIENNLAEISFNNGQKLSISKAKFVQGQWNFIDILINDGSIKTNINKMDLKTETKNINQSNFNDIFDESLVLGFETKSINSTVEFDDYKLIVHKQVENIQNDALSKNQNDMIYSGQNYIKYSFKNKIVRASENEELDLSFQFKDDLTSGLIWFSESGSERSYIFLKDSRLYYVYIYRKTEGQATMTATEEIYVPEILSPNTVHKLVIKRVADQLTLTVNENNKANRIIRVGTSPLIHPNGNMYIGGHPEPDLVTNGKINSRFKGSIKNIAISGNRHEKLDLIDLFLNREDWKTNIQNVGAVKVGNFNQRNYEHTGEYLISSVPVPVTVKEFDSLVRFSPWDFEQFESIEMEFRTKEPRGVLLFVGPDTSHTDYVCLEFFDRNLYLVFGMEARDYRIQLNQKGYPVTTGTFHRVFIKRDKSHRFTARFDGVEINIGQDSGHQRSFGSYTYIGGVDNPSRLPWSVWSRVGFVGCINYIRVNEEKYIDPRGNNNQHSSEIIGVEIGICLKDTPSCTASLCEGGICHDRTYPYSTNDNYFCECASTSKTYKFPVNNILRKEKCVRSSENIVSDGTSFYLVDFKSEDSRDKIMKTHTDDINISFKTTDATGTIFQTFRTNSKLYFSVHLKNGYIVLETNINDKDERNTLQTYKINKGGLNNNQWHTVFIKRRGDYIELYVDDKSNKKIGKLPVLDRTFDNVFEYIIVGSNNFETTTDKMKGEFRNFYWNKFDFFGTRRLAGTYRGTIKTRKPVEPPLPPYPRDPPTKCTMTYRHRYTHVPDVLTQSEEPGFFIEFKTRYNGIIWHAYDPASPNERFISLIIVDNKLVMVYRMNDDRNVRIVEDGTRLQCSDNNWHRAITMIHKKLKRITFIPDKGFSPVIVNLALNGELDFNRLNFYFGGMPDDMYNEVFTDFRVKYPRLAEKVAMNTQRSLVGCLGEFMTSHSDFKKNLLASGTSTFPINSLDCTGCHNPVKCDGSYCKNGGICYEVSVGKLGCRCERTGFIGDKCEIIEPKCPNNFCYNGGKCYLVGNNPKCDCTNTGFIGDRCEQSHCTANYCYNGGRCTVVNGQPTCNCKNTDYKGKLCEIPICTNNYCLNGGRCNVVNNNPVCDCIGTGFYGERCDRVVCTNDFCQNGGRCVPRNNRPTCECPPNFTGPQCGSKVCPDNFCFNGGNCYAFQGRPQCNCPSHYSGSRCEIIKKCPDGYCRNRGVCYLQNGYPYCDCSSTDYQGTQCEQRKICPEGYCANNGQCSILNGAYVCNCPFNFRGDRCQEVKECPKNYCLNNGVCSVNSDGTTYSCNCENTGYGGLRCDNKIWGILNNYDLFGYIIYDIQNPQPTNKDSISVGFQTYLPSGTIYTFKTIDGKYLSLKMDNGKLLIDVNGRLTYLGSKVNNGYYHVVTIERKNDVLLVNLRGDKTESITMGARELTGNDNVILFKQIIIGANNVESDIFKGAIGGLTWNGRFISKEIKNGKGIRKGSVEIILVPTTIKMPPVSCPNNYCKNNGMCIVTNYQPICRCENTGYFGARCDKKTYGIFPSKYSNGGYMILNFIPPKSTNKDKMELLFQAFTSDNPIVRFELNNGKFYEISMIGGQLYLTNSENLIIDISNGKRMDNQNPYWLKFERNFNEIVFYVNDQKTATVQLTGLVENNGILTHRRIVLGADQKFMKYFQGAIGGFDWNGERMITKSGEVSTNVVKKGEVVIVLMPYINATIVGPKKELPDKVIGESHGGVVWTKNTIYIPGIGIGGGAIVPSGGGPVLVGSSALMLLPFNPLVAGLLMALLLLTSALLWACWRCKPGCCPCCAGLAHGKPKATAAALANRLFTPVNAGAAGAKTGEKSIWSRMKSTYVTAPNAGFKGDNTALLANNGMANGTVDQGDFHTTTVREERYNRTIGGSMHSLQGGMHNSNVRTVRSAADANDYRFGTIGQGSIMRIDTTHHETDLGGGVNVFAGEEMKVDCCVLTQDSRFAVTGSDSGTPQVWDMESGELFKIMDGMEIGCTDLHLACHDKVLIGLVADDAIGNQQSRLKRLQMWDFLSGAEIAMPGDIMSSASCISHSADHLILNREHENGDMSILVWNIEANQPVQEIYYDPSNQMNHDGVTFLKLSHDDKMVVAGYTSVDEQAHYMVFDLSASYPSGVVIQPLKIDFNAKTSASEIIGINEAITGTKTGELIVWNLKKVNPIRKIALYATLDGNVQKKIDPHKGPINCVVLSKDGQYLVSGSADQTVNVYTMSDERLLHSLEGHADDVLSVAISNDNEMIVSGSWDGSMRVWNLQSGAQMCWFTSNIEILQVKLTNDKSSIVALGERMGLRKLIMLKIVRNKSRRTRHTDGTVGTPPFSTITSN